MHMNLEFHRNMLGYTQSALAQKAGLTASAISMIESGDRDPSLATAIKLAQALDITLDELAGLSPPKSTGDLRRELKKANDRLEKIRALSACRSSE